VTLRFHSLQSRILFFILSLFTVIQSITFLAVNTANWRLVNRQIEDDLLVSGRVFERFMEERVSQLMLNAKLLSGDFAFKQAYADSDRDTLFSAVTNLQQHRIGADVMMLVDAEDHLVIIDTLSPDARDKVFPFPALIETAEETGKPSSSIEAIGRRIYHLVVVPLLAPEPVAWTALGFLVDDRLAASLKQLTLTDVSFLRKQDHGAILASTLGLPLRDALARSTQIINPAPGDHFSWEMENERYVALAITLSDQIRVVLQRSLDQALAPFEKLYRVLVMLSLFALALSIVGGILIARTVTRPVRTLVEGTQKIEKGDYHHQIDITQHDEIGRLAQAFNKMTRGLAAFHRYLPVDLVRTLIDKGIESRPETRVATILFTDIENFTNLVEQLSPERIVNMLNAYFSAVTIPIEKYQGVITQFQGDAILAVFNVPTDDPDHAIHALRAALEINRTVAVQQFAGITLNNRVGVNTGEVVAGSVGSENRLNYTVHGDAVNLASRLEVLNKEYGTRVLASQATIDLAGGGIPCEQIGKISIRGRQEMVKVYKLA